MRPYSARHMALYRLIVEGSEFPVDVTFETLEELNATIVDKTSLGDLLLALEAHATSVYAHSALYYTKAQIDAMVSSQSLTPQLMERLTKRSVLWELDEDGSLEPEIAGVDATVENNLLWELNVSEELTPKEDLTIIAEGNWILDDDGDICIQGLG